MTGPSSTWFEFRSHCLIGASKFLSGKTPWKCIFLQFGPYFFQPELNPASCAMRAPSLIMAIKTRRINLEGIWKLGPRSLHSSKQHHHYCLYISYFNWTNLCLMGEGNDSRMEGETSCIMAICQKLEKEVLIMNCCSMTLWELLYPKLVGNQLIIKASRKRDSHPTPIQISKYLSLIFSLIGLDELAN